MTINKLAGWGDTPVAGLPSPGLGQRVADGFAGVVAAQAPLAKLDTTLSDLSDTIGDATANLALRAGSVDQSRRLRAGQTGFEVERRTRLAELATSEWQVMATVTDKGTVVPTGSAAPRARRAAKP